MEEQDIEKNIPAKKAPAKKAPAKKAVAKKDAVDVIIPEDVQEIDQTDPVSNIIEQSQILVYMKTGQSYHCGNLIFTIDKPFKLMDEPDAQALILSMPEKFEYATKDQVEKFYSIG